MVTPKSSHALISRIGTLSRQLQIFVTQRRNFIRERSRPWVKAAYLSDQSISFGQAFILLTLLTALLGIGNYLVFRSRLWSCFALAAIDIQPPLIVGCLIGALMWVAARATDRQPSRNIILTVISVTAFISIVAMTHRLSTMSAYP